MIPYPRPTSGAPDAWSLRLIGVGNAGVHLADRITMAAPPSLEVIAMNTDTQSLSSSVAPRKIALGATATRGLGAGGDPELGYEAGQEALPDICSAVEGANVVFVCAGLGGGTGSGAASIVAAAARDAGAVVISIVTSPFGFEGRRRAAQAAAALETLTQYSAAVIHFENDRMAELSSPRTGIEETFAASDGCLAACVAALAGMLDSGGPMPVSLSDLLAAVGGGTPAALFGRGESRGDNRAHEALENALKSPLLDRGRMLSDTHAIIAHISGPPSLSFSEVAAIMRELSRHASEMARLFLGVSVMNDASAPLSVTLLGNLVREEAPAPETPAAGKSPEPPAPAEEEKELLPEEPPSAEETDAVPAAPRRVVEKPSAPQPSPREAAKPKPGKPAAPKVKQETLQFEAVARGRFEKSEPTIVEGEDLDVPTFLRRRNKTK